VAGAIDSAVFAEFSEPPAGAEPADWNVPVAAAWLSPAEVALPWSPVSSEGPAILPGEKLMISEAADRLLMAAGSWSGIGFGTAGSGTLGACLGALIITTRGELAWW
jgi:hypothetical protein